MWIGDRLQHDFKDTPNRARSRAAKQIVCVAA